MAQSIIQQAYENYERKKSFRIPRKRRNLSFTTKSKDTTQKIAKKVVEELLTTFRSLRAEVRSKLNEAGLSPEVGMALMEAIDKVLEKAISNYEGRSDMSEGNKDEKILKKKETEEAERSEVSDSLPSDLELPTGISEDYSATLTEIPETEPPGSEKKEEEAEVRLEEEKPPLTEEKEGEKDTVSDSARTPEYSQAPPQSDELGEIKDLISELKGFLASELSQLPERVANSVFEKTQEAYNEQLRAINVSLASLNEALGVLRTRDLPAVIKKVFEEAGSEVKSSVEEPKNSKA